MLGASIDLDSASAMCCNANGVRKKPLSFGEPCSGNLREMAIGVLG
jgi:hypothetical protein